MAVTTHKASAKAPAQSTPKGQLVPHVKMTLKGHEKAVNDIAFIHGTRLVVSGSHDKSLRVEFIIRLTLVYTWTQPRSPYLCITTMASSVQPRGLDK
ncbi:hypothetical protein P692DRAFT_20838734 [Suillus brevipes Sb2]|nr:hypothetical protein P692DRAFT_20838734 [Suillus brevipes Sb2]